MLTLDPFKFTCWVSGRPATKGSMKCLGARTKGGRHVLVEDHATSKPWRTRMTNEIVRDVRRAGLPGAWKPYVGALLVHAAFYYDQPATGVGASLPWPTIEAGCNANGDLDKLLRNLLDSLQGSGLIKNDSQVVQISSSKRWATDGGAGVMFLVDGDPR
jgi:hypothetical protein